MKMAAQMLRVLQPDIDEEKYSDKGVPTVTSDEQIKVEKNIAALFTYFRNTIEVDSKEPLLQRERHIAYLKKGLKHLPGGFQCLDASRPWLLYWAMHALELLEVKLTDQEAKHIIDFLGKCQNPTGGFGGGPAQYSHLAPTYAAVNAVAIIGTKEAYDMIDREKLQEFLWNMRTDEGAFRMHEGGEVDIRGVYCAVSVARLTNIASEGLFSQTGHWIMRCQTYEGGFSGTPGMEAHGGYTFCGIAALTLLNSHHLCDTPALLRWASKRQMRFEGGFQGRTNKLVDGCYSFWQGGLFPILHTLLAQEDAGNLSAERWMFNQEALQEYLLICCQHPRGGLIDKPGKYSDFYHTCYTLSGMSVAQHFSTAAIHKKCIVGHSSNELSMVHPLYNIGVESSVLASQYFNSLPVPRTRESSEASANRSSQEEETHT